MPKLFVFVLSLLLLGSCNRPPQSSALAQTYAPEPIIELPPKNVILMIGDGMGINQVSAAMFSTDQPLALEQFTFVGIQKPYSASSLITDSAAGATAFACGVKTYNGAIGVDQDSMPVKTLVEEAGENGLSTGVITTSTIVHATPAAFLAHRPSRKMTEAIAIDILSSQADLLIGGGKKYFDQRETDLRNLYKELGSKNYQVSDYYKTRLEDLDFSGREKLAYFTANGDPVPVSKGRDYLPYACKMAPGFLQQRSDKGFFLVVEAAQIDWAGHANDSDYLIEEMLDFDRAIGELLQFAKEDGRTLIIVTGDHETGGYSLNPGSQWKKLIPAFTSEYHTATLIPVFAYGPGGELFSGIYENTDIHKKIRQALQFSEPASIPETHRAGSN
jgi:alkaline phosphatase